MGLSENGIAASSPDSVILSSCSLGSLLFPDSLQTQVCVVFLSGNTMYILWMGFSKHVGLPESNYVYVYTYIYIYTYTVYIHIASQERSQHFCCRLSGKAAQVKWELPQPATSIFGGLASPLMGLWFQDVDGSGCGASTRFWGFSPSANGERRCRGSNGRDMCMSIRVYHVSVWEYRRMSFYHVRPFWQVLFRLRHGNSPMLLDIDNILLHSHFFYILPSGNLT